MTTKHFTHTVEVVRPDGETALWVVDVTAQQAGAGEWYADVRVVRNRGTVVFEGFTLSNQAPCVPAHRSWEVRSGYTQWPLNQIIESDGYDFGSLRRACEAIADRCTRAAIKSTFPDAYAEIVRVIGTNPAFGRARYTATPLPVGLRA